MPRIHFHPTIALNLKFIFVYRANKLDLDNSNWQSVWPGPRTFDPNVIPIPVRQGRLKLQYPAITKYANLELMKIPNFFHLTPPVIKAQCKELKKFCTPFPKELDTKEKCEKHFPVTVITNDYLHSAPTIRDPLARIVTIKVCNWNFFQIIQNTF